MQLTIGNTICYRWNHCSCCSNYRHQSNTDDVYLLANYVKRKTNVWWLITPSLFLLPPRWLCELASALPLLLPASTLLLWWFFYFCILFSSPVVHITWIPWVSLVKSTLLRNGIRNQSISKSVNQSLFLFIISLSLSLSLSLFRSLLLSLRWGKVRGSRHSLQFGGDFFFFF